MNDVILQFLVQAEEFADIEYAKKLSRKSWQTFVYEKFVALLVQECIDIAHQKGDNVAYLASHFGVEE